MLNGWVTYDSAVEILAAYAAKAEYWRCKFVENDGKVLNYNQVPQNPRFSSALRILIVD